MRVSPIANTPPVVDGGAAVAPIVRGTTVNTTVRDFDGDGLPDRLIGFRMSDLVAAGFSAGTRDLVLRTTATPSPWEARDATPPAVAP